MNGPNLMQFAMNMIKQNPNIARNPQAQAMLQVLQSGDAQKGQQIAQNLCQTYGITPEQAAMINTLNLAQSQANQNQYLVNTLRPCPVPAYQVQNPWATSQYGGCCGSNSNCCNYG